jgi:hypothetical protein
MKPQPCLLLVCAAALVGCASSPADPAPPHAPREVVELAVWEVRSGEQFLGTLRQLEIRDPSGPLRFYRLEDRDGRWLGHASPEGRFSRRVPFADQEEDLGVWPLARGVALLLGVENVVLGQPAAVPVK